MTLTKVSESQYEVECDGCPSEFLEVDGDFQTVRETLVDEGWSTHKSPDDGKWEHYGPACTEEGTFYERHPNAGKRGTRTTSGNPGSRGNRGGNRESKDRSRQGSSRCRP